VGEKSKVGVKIHSRGLSDTFLAGKNKWNILPRVSVPQIQRQTSVKIRFGTLGVPRVTCWSGAYLELVNASLSYQKGRGLFLSLSHSLGEC